MRLKLSQPSLAGVGAGAELGNRKLMSTHSRFFALMSAKKWLCALAHEYT